MLSQFSLGTSESEADERYLLLYNSNFSATRTIQFYDQTFFSATFHRFHIQGLLRKTFSKKAVGSPWVHPQNDVRIFRDFLPIDPIRGPPLLEGHYKNDDLKIHKTRPWSFILGVGALYEYRSYLCNFM